MSAVGARTRRLRLGRRRESIILLPVALLLLIALTGFVLFSYRQSLELLTDDRRQEAAQLAQRLSALLASDEVASAEALGSHLPFAARLALVDEEGRSLARIGLFERQDLLLPAAGRDLGGPLAVGPESVEPGWIIAFAPLEWRGKRRFLRLDLPAERLAGQLRGLRMLMRVVLAADLAVAALVVLFLRSLLAPFETMLARARELEPQARSEEDEVAYLVSTFERAVEALSRPASGSEDGEDDITALERTLGSSLESGLLLLDREGRAMALNRFGASLLGVPKPAAGTPFEQVLEDHEALRTVLGKAVSRGQAVQRQEVEIRLGDGDRTLGLTVHPLRRDDGTVRAFLVLFADLTEARRALEEQRLSKTLRQIGELAAGVAHEMRNSLATITGYLALIERAPEEGAIQDHVRELKRETEHVRRVLEDFLSFARPGSTRMEAIDLESVVRRAAGDPALAVVGVRVERRAGAATVLPGDAQLLERAVRNLLHNAAEAQRRAGRSDRLEVVLEADEGSIGLTVADRGDGIPPEVRERLFQPFVSSSPEGVGLGLALARRIVDLHGGRLSLEDRPDGGTLASILFERGTIVTNRNSRESGGEAPDSLGSQPND